MEGSALITVMIGSLLERYDTLATAEQMFRKSIEFCPTYSQAYSKLGDIALQRGEIGKAKGNYRAAIHLTPNKLDALLNLANLYQQSHEYDRALALYRKILKIQPDASTAYNNMGLTYDLMGRWDDAESAYKKAIRLSPNMALYYNGLGTHYMAQGRSWDAIQALEKHIAMQPDSLMGHYNLGLVYEQMQEFQTAAGYFRKAVSLPVHGSLAQGIALASLDHYFALCVDNNLCRAQAGKFLKTLSASSYTDEKVAHNARLLRKKMNQEKAPSAGAAESSGINMEIPYNKKP